MLSYSTWISSSFQNYHLKTCLSDDHIHRLLETFEEIDTDKTGTITDEGKDLHYVCYQWKLFFKLYTLSYSDSSFIRWDQKSKKSQN